MGPTQAPRRRPGVEHPASIARKLADPRTPDGFGPVRIAINGRFLLRPVTGVERYGINCSAVAEVWPGSRVLLPRGGQVELPEGPVLHAGGGLKGQRLGAVRPALPVAGRRTSFHPPIRVLWRSIGRCSGCTDLFWRSVRLTGRAAGAGYGSRGWRTGRRRWPRSERTRHLIARSLWGCPSPWCRRSPRSCQLVAYVRWKVRSS